MAESGVSGERLYLSGDFIVSAKGDNKAVLRPKVPDSGSVPLRVIAEFAAGSVVPLENAMIAFDSTRALEILEITRAEDGTVNVWVRDATRR